MSKQIHRSTPLYTVQLSEGILETIKGLFESGVDLKLRNYRNELPIDTAKRQNQVEVISYLKKLY